MTESLLERAKKTEWESAKPAPASTEVVDPFMLSEARNDGMASPDWMEDTEMAARAVLDGFTYGFSEEVGASLLAASAIYLGDSSAEGKDYLDLRRSMLFKMEADSAEFMERRPEVAWPALLVGGVLSGGMIAKGASLAFNAARPLVETSKFIQPAITAIQKPVAALQQAKLTKALEASKNAAAPATTVLERSIANPAATTTAFGRVVNAGKTGIAAIPALAVEGGTASVGFSPQGTDVVDAAAQGVGTSIAFGAPMVAVMNGTLAAIARRKLVQDLGKGEDFIPLTHATDIQSSSVYERGLNWWYKTIVGKAFVSDRLLAQQQKGLTESLDISVRENASLLNKAQATAKNKLAAQKNTLTSALAVKEDTLSLQKSASKQTIKSTAGTRGEDIKAQQVLEADAAVNAMEEAFRTTVANKAIPTGVGSKRKTEIMGIEDIQLRRSAADDAWAAKGFSMISDRSFRINLPAFADDLVKRVGPDLKILQAEVGSAPINLGSLVIETLNRDVSNGRITGEAINNLRKIIGKKVGDLTTNAASRTAMLEIKNSLDDLIKGQLSGKALEDFNVEKIAYQAHLQGKAAELAAIQNRGRYTVEQYIGTLKGVNSRQASRGESVLQQEAYSVNKVVAERNLMLQNAAKARLKAVQKEQQEALHELEASFLEKQRQLKTNFTTKQNTVERTAEVESRQQVLSEVAGRLKAAKDHFKSMAARPDAALFEKLAAYWFQGGFIDGIAGKLAGIVMAPLSVAQVSQRTLAGQTSGQEAIMRMLESGNALERAVTAGARASQMPQENQMSYQALTTLLKAPDIKKVQVYNTLERTGKLEKLRSANKPVYDALVAAKKRYGK